MSAKRMLAASAVSALLVSQTWAQTPEFASLVQYGTTGPAADIANAVDTDSNGSIYVTGVTQGVLGSSSRGGQDIFVRKYSSGGAVLATVQLGTAGDDVALAVFVDGSGVYVGGTTDGSFLGQTSHGGQDAFVLRLDHDLAGPSWITQFGSPADDAVQDLEGDGTAVYSTGWTAGALPNQDSSSGFDAFLVRMDTAGGTINWTNQFGTFGNDRAFGAAVNSTGVYVTGSTSGAMSGAFNGGGSDIFLRKFNFSGAVQWTRQYGTGGSDEGLAACADAANVYLAGVDGLANDNASVRKVDFDGTLLWHTPLVTPSSDEARAVDCSTTAVAVAGRTQGPLFSALSAGADDVFAATLNPGTGALLWGRQTGSGFFDSGNGIAIDQINVVVAGQANGLVPSANPQGTVGSADGFVWQLGTSDGAHLWAAQFGTLGPVNDTARSVSGSSAGVYVAGEVGGPLPGQTHSGLADAYVRRFNANAAVLTTSQFGSPGVETALAFVHPTGIYVAGTTQGLLPDTTKLGDAVGPSDAYLARFNADGTLVRRIQFGTDRSETATGIAGDDTGIYVVGNVGVGADSDVSVWKFDFDLDAQFNVVFGSIDSRADFANGIAADANGVYVVGQTFGSLPAHPPSGPLPDGFVWALAGANGSTLWTRVVQSTGPDTAAAVATDSSGVYVVGQVQGQLAGQVWAGATDAFVRKFHFDGSEIVTRVIGSPLGDSALAIAADNQAVYLGGLTGGVLPGENSAGLVDAYVMKYTTNLDQVWTLQFGSAQVDNVLGLSANNLGIFASGLTTGALPGQTTAGGADAFVGRIVELIPAVIDIKPNTSPNNIKLGSGGTVPVAILSTSTFDALSVNAATVTLAGAPVKLNGQGSPLMSSQDVNGDGRLDLIVHITTQGLQLTKADTQAELLGDTNDGRSRIRGVDAIRVIP